MTVCAECGRQLGVAGRMASLEMWEHVPSDDTGKDRPAKRFFVCSAVTPLNASGNVARETPGWCYSPERHIVYAGTCETDWVLVARR